MLCVSSVGVYPLKKPLVSPVWATPAPLSSMVGLHMKQAARGTYKRSPSAYREEGYRVAMETDSPTPGADGGGVGIGGWV